ncbi:unnamed protein product [Lasius platythorax]|uniref:Uncharacterized protein n=1 Tax=Lasius platythorax TaxID=488582 RepID=A0AAV2NA98_9HYME
MTARQSRFKIATCESFCEHLRSTSINDEKVLTFSLGRPHDLPWARRVIPARGRLAVISGPLLLTTRKNTRVYPYAVMRAILLSSGNARCEYALRARLSSSLMTRGGGGVPEGGRNQLISKQFLERVRLRGQTIPISFVLDAANLPSFADLAFRGHSSVFEPANIIAFIGKTTSSDDLIFFQENIILRAIIRSTDKRYGISLIHCTDTVD